MGNLYAGWIGMLAGCLAGAVTGLFFHDPDWLGGYASWPRRMVRLGHIAFFGIGFINVIFALSAERLGLAGRTQPASYQAWVGVLQQPYQVRQYTYSYGGTNYSIVDNGLAYRGIDVFSYCVRHETRHRHDMIDWWGMAGIDSSDEVDADYVRDSIEALGLQGFPASEGGPYDPANTYTHGSSGTPWTTGDPDSQVECCFTQDATGEACAHTDIDWAYPGSRWY